MPSSDDDTALAGAAGLLTVLERDIGAGRWAPGERLPTERELGIRYGVARNTVRRALDALEAQDLIHRHVGRGTFLKTRPGGDDSLSPSDVVECRLLLEPELISLAVSRATASDIARMSECLAGTETAADLAAFEHWDAELHDAFALGTHNAAVLAMSRSLARVRERTDWGQLKARGNTGERRNILQSQHRAMVGAIRDRDRGVARRVMREHILFVQSYMFDD